MEGVRSSTWVEENTCQQPQTTCTRWQHHDPGGMHLFVLWCMPVQPYLVTLFVRTLKVRQCACWGQQSLCIAIPPHSNRPSMPFRLGIKGMFANRCGCCLFPAACWPVPAAHRSSQHIHWDAMACDALPQRGISVGQAGVTLHHHAASSKLIAC